MRRLGYLPLLVLVVLACAGSTERRAMMLEDEKPTDSAQSRDLRESDRPRPFPVEPPAYFAQPDDPRPAALLEDLEVREGRQARPGGKAEAGPRALPTEEELFARAEEPPGS